MKSLSQGWILCTEWLSMRKSSYIPPLVFETSLPEDEEPGWVRICDVTVLRPVLVTFVLRRTWEVTAWLRVCELDEAVLLPLTGCATRWDEEALLLT